MHTITASLSFLHPLKQGAWNLNAMEDTLPFPSFCVSSTVPAVDIARRRPYLRQNAAEVGSGGQGRRPFAKSEKGRAPHTHTPLASPHCRHSLTSARLPPRPMEEMLFAPAGSLFERNNKSGNTRNSSLTVRQRLTLKKLSTPPKRASRHVARDIARHRTHGSIFSQGDCFVCAPPRGPP